MNYLISIIGPTGIGKTAMSIALAKHYNCDIISSDSRQFYKEMRIGTAVPEAHELAQVKHHFIQHLSIKDSYSVGNFEKDALDLLKETFKNNPKMVMVGGSGLYVKAVLEGLDNFPKVPVGIREDLNRLYSEEGLLPLQNMLQTKDPETYNSIDLNNPHRVIRALEVCIASDKPYSYFKNKPKVSRDFKSIVVGLTAKRPTIYQRIDERVDQMIANGLYEEAKKLYPFRALNALNTVGYKEIFEHLDSKISLEFAIAEIKKNTRRFAKRQNTWFKKSENTQWFDYQTPVEQIIAYIDTMIE